jgi:hypothetical protein
MLNLVYLFVCLPFVSTSILLSPDDELEIRLGHFLDQRENRITIYFDISNSTFENFRWYFFDFRPFAQREHIEYFFRQRLIETRNSLTIEGLHENDYVSCVSFVDEFNNVYKPRFACYEFTLGEKLVGSHHRGSSGYLSPLLVAVVFVIHVFIAVVHHIKAKRYAQRILQRFIDVNPKSGKRQIHPKTSLKQLDQNRPSISIRRRLSRVAVDVHPTEVSSTSYANAHRKASVAFMKTIPEQNV